MTSDLKKLPWLAPLGSIFKATVIQYNNNIIIFSVRALEPWTRHILGNDISFWMTAEWELCYLTRVFQAFCTVNCYHSKLVYLKDPPFLLSLYTCFFSILFFSLLIGLILIDLSKRGLACPVWFSLVIKSIVHWLAVQGAVSHGKCLTLRKRAWQKEWVVESSR